MPNPNPKRKGQKPQKRKSQKFHVWKLEYHRSMSAGRSEGLSRRLATTRYKEKKRKGLFS